MNTYSVLGYQPIVENLQSLGEGTKNWVKENPYAAASIATMPFPLLSGGLGLKASYDMFKDSPESHTALNYGLAGLDVLPFIGAGRKIGRGVIDGNLLSGATRQFGNLLDYITPNNNLLAATANVPSRSMPPSATNTDSVSPVTTDNWLGMFVGKRDPRYRSASQVAADKHTTGKTDAEIFQETGVIRKPHGIFKGGDDLENALEVTDDYEFSPYMLKRYRDKIKNRQFLTKEQLDLYYFALDGMAGRKGITMDRTIIENSPIYKEYKRLPTLRDLFSIGTDIDELFKAYPEMANTKIHINLDPSAHNVSGVFYDFGSKNQDLFSPTIQINARTPEDAIQAIKHEMQHNIQVIEKWTKGGSTNSITSIRNRLRKNIQRLPESARDDIGTLNLAYRHLEAKIRKAPRYSDKYEKEFFDIINSIRNRYEDTQLFDRVHEFAKIEAGLLSGNQLTRDKAAMEAYFRFGGEVQARATQYRSGMSMADRLNKNPYFVPPEGRNLLTGEPRAVAGKQLERLLFGRDKTVQSVEHGSPYFGAMTDAEALRRPRIQYPDSHIID